MKRKLLILLLLALKPLCLGAITSIDDVPADILEDIKADAESEWPGNSEMRLMTIEDEIAAYNELHGN